jgi:ankyrin repeat protein
MKLLLGAGGADVDAASVDGCTALSFASVGVKEMQQGPIVEVFPGIFLPQSVPDLDRTVEAMAVLLDAGADVDAADIVGHTSLYAASRYGKAPAVQFLLKAGAHSVGLMHHLGNGAPPTLTSSWRRPRNESFLDDRAGIAGPTDPFIHLPGSSPLHVAAASGHLACVEALTGFRPRTVAWLTFLVGSKTHRFHPEEVTVDDAGVGEESLAGACKELLVEALRDGAAQCLGDGAGVGNEASNVTTTTPRLPGDNPRSFLAQIYDAEGPRRLIEEFQRERYSDLHLKNKFHGMTALELAEKYSKDDVASVLRNMMVLKVADKDEAEGKARV